MTIVKHDNNIVGCTKVNFSQLHLSSTTTLWGALKWISVSFTSTTKGSENFQWKSKFNEFQEQLKSKVGELQLWFETLNLIRGRFMRGTCAHVFHQEAWRPKSSQMFSARSKGRTVASSSQIYCSYRTEIRKKGSLKFRFAKPKDISAMFRTVKWNHRFWLK